MAPLNIALGSWGGRYALSRDPRISQGLAIETDINASALHLRRIDENLLRACYLLSFGFVVGGATTDLLGGSLNGFPNLSPAYVDIVSEWLMPAMLHKFGYVVNA